MNASISQAHNDCVSIFLAFIASRHDPSSYLKHQDEVQDTFDRYKLWAGNVGAIHSGRISLDHRLRDASFFKIQVLKLMHDLQSCYCKASSTLGDNSVAAHDGLAENFEPSCTDMDESDWSDSTWEVSSDSEIEQSPKGQLPRKTSNMRTLQPHLSGKPGLLDSINFIIDCLWKLPIRRPAPIDRMKSKHATDTAGYLPYDIMHVRDKFPDLNEIVAARLAKMITRRRQLIRYRQDHTKALQGEEVKMTEFPKFESSPVPIHIESGVVGGSTPSLRAPSQHTEITKATTVKLSKPLAALSPAIGLYAPSISEFGSSTASEQTANAITIRIPDRPTGKGGTSSGHFICPYCSTALLITSDRAWKKHVLSDLQPYVCTYPDCELHDYMFESLGDWFRHESQTHRVEWSCNTESHESISDTEEFLNHMRTVHSEPLYRTQVPSLRRGFQRHTNVNSGTCTLCGEYANKLRTHLARHLEQLALFAIPQTDYMAALEEDDTSSNAARQGVRASSSTSSTNVVSTRSIPESDPDFERSDHNAFHASSRRYVTSLESLSEEYEGEIDTSWDQITPKFKEARVAMPTQQEVETSKRRTRPRSNAIILGGSSGDVLDRYNFAK
ncbi:hypothetical protein BKA58DRAFT_376336 [Alternaria rosae]|uniref:uncharacterized protein n=1 Tax=Alternaria rosae TaxID=1187941 RepID=UPI001E8CBAFE|nr:uncharacterized protein BKA58DRAFT_376336 [Alternaria rosae]KAH6878006.1 hypothetical protein BKA58DRAFT_376336 [Alternaria rosae]